MPYQEILEYYGQEIEFQFTYIHPESACPNSNRSVTIDITALDQDAAKVFAENTPVLCDFCGTDYNLQT